MTQKYRHKGNNRIYQKIENEELKYSMIKQGSGDLWDEAVFYMDCETLQTYVTGRQRFLERFIETKG